MYYKYREVSEWTENYITKQEIWAAKPSTLNDPFECKISPFAPADLNRHIAKIKQNQLQGFIVNAHRSHENGEHFFDIKGRAIIQLLNKIKKAKNLDKKYKIANGFYKSIGHSGFSNPKGQTNSLSNFLDTVGIFSLSEDPLNMLMWSHYGENHKGIAFGFDAIKGSDLANEEYFQPVTYSDESLNIDLSQGMLNGVDLFIGKSGKPTLKSYFQIKDKQIQKVLFTKTKSWKYEKEWRYMTKKFGAYSHPGKLSEIIFGLKSTKKTIKNYSNLCTKHIDHKIDYYQIVQKPNSTQLSMKKINV